MHGAHAGGRFPAEVPIDCYQGSHGPIQFGLQPGNTRPGCTGLHWQRDLRGRGRFPSRQIAGPFALLAFEANIASVGELRKPRPHEFNRHFHAGSQVVVIGAREFRRKPDLDLGKRVGVAALAGHEDLQLVPAYIFGRARGCRAWRARD